MLRSRLRLCHSSLLLLSMLLVGEWTLGDALFIRGDADASGRLDIADAMTILRALFGGEGAMLQCPDAADSDDDGQVELADALGILERLFRGGGLLPGPGSFCGRDATTDELDCNSFPACASDLDAIARDADAVVFVIDRSASMQDRGELTFARNAVAAAIRGLLDGGELGVVFFDRNTLSLPATGPLLVSDAGSRATAEAYVLGMPGGPGSCVGMGLLAALDLLLASRAADKALIYYGDGGATCAGAPDEAEAIQRALEGVTGRNAGQVAIHTVAVMSDAKWLQELATRNGGTFHQIVR